MDWVNKIARKKLLDATTVLVLCVHKRRLKLILILLIKKKRKVLHNWKALAILLNKIVHQFCPQIFILMMMMIDRYFLSVFVYHFFA